MKIAITGGTGFVGSHFAKLLQAQGHEIVSLSRRTGIDLANSEIESLKKAIQGCEAIAHCAGINREIGTQTYQNIHVQGTKNIVQASQESGVKKIVLLSFLRARPDCGSLYHESKWEAEEIIRNSNLDYTIFKAGVIYGKGDHMLDHLSHAFYTFPIFGLVGFKKKQVRPIAVEDMAQLIYASLIENKLKQKTVAVLGPEELSLEEAVKRVAAAVKKKPFFFRMPVSFHYCLAWLCERSMKIPMLSIAQTRILSEGVVDFGPACQPLPQELAPQISFNPTQIEKGLPPAKAFGWKDIQCSCFAS